MVDDILMVGVPLIYIQRVFTRDNIDIFSKILIRLLSQLRANNIPEVTSIADSPAGNAGAYLKDL